MSMAMAIIFITMMAFTNKTINNVILISTSGLILNFDNAISLHAIINGGFYKYYNPDCHAYK